MPDMNENLTLVDGTDPMTDRTVPTVDLSQVYLYLKASPPKSTDRKPPTYVGYTINPDTSVPSTNADTVESSKGALDLSQDKPKTPKKRYRGWRDRKQQRGKQRKDQVGGAAKEGVDEGNGGGEEDGGEKEVDKEDSSGIAGARNQ